MAERCRRAHCISPTARPSEPTDAGSGLRAQHSSDPRCARACCPEQRTAGSLPARWTPRRQKQCPPSATWQSRLGSAAKPCTAPTMESLTSLCLGPATILSWPTTNKHSHLSSQARWHPRSDWQHCSTWRATPRLYPFLSRAPSSAGQCVYAHSACRRPPPPLCERRRVPQPASLRFERRRRFGSFYHIV